MPDKSRQTANLVSDSNLTVDVINDRIGIGSATPQQKLDVQGGNGFVRIGQVESGYNGITLNNLTAGGNYNFLSSSSDTTLYINRPSNSQINFRIANSTDQMILSTSGNLGINSTTPTSRLDVRGDVRISGVVTATAYYGNGAFLSNVSTGTDITSSLFS